MNKISSKELLKYRNVWLGCAMIWIVWYHSKLNPTLDILKYIKGLGYGGVDICLFASGVGCYFSLNKDTDVYSFMKRRFLRLMPTYWVFIIVWLLFKGVTEKLTAQAILGNFLGIHSFIGLEVAFNWYISAIILFYILAPFLKCVAQKTSTIQHKTLVIILLVIISIPFWNVNEYIVIVTRIPIFYIGMLFANFCISEKIITKRILLFFVGSMVVGFLMLVLFWTRYNNFLWNYGFYWYPFILITPGLCIMVSYIMYFLDKSRGNKIILLLDRIGQYSFEIYLVHILVFDVIEYMISPMEVLPDTFLVWVLAVVCIALCCIVLRFVSTLLNKCIRCFGVGQKN